MSNVFSKLRSVKLSTKIITTALAAAIIVPATLFAWGPTRPTFNINHPSDHITFDSITDNPYVGDERNFVRIKDASNTGAGGWADQLNVQPGKEYMVQLYVHNNAASNLNLVAQNTRVMATVPNKTAKQVTVEGFVTADNSNPRQIWDQAVFNSDKDFNLTYEAGSAKLYNNVFTNGTPISDGIVTSNGALVGFDKLDGKLPGCFNYAGYVNFKVKAQVAQTANFTMRKEVSKHDAKNWQENITAVPGEVVDYIIRYKNTAEARQDDVMVKDTLPAGMTYVNGSTKLATVAQPDGAPISDNVTTKGVNIGSYAAGAGTWVKFSAKVTGNDSLPACGNNLLHNVARVETDFGYREDSADVTVNRVCQPGTPSTPVTELPQTGIDTGVLTFVGLGITTATAAYAATSARVRNLLRR